VPSSHVFFKDQNGHFFPVIKGITLELRVSMFTILV